MFDSFFEVHINVRVNERSYFTQGPYKLGPYFSYGEAARVMMDGLHISLAEFWEHLAQLDKHQNATVSSKIVECVFSDGKVEQLAVKSEETRAVSFCVYS